MSSLKIIIKQWLSILSIVITPSLLSAQHPSPIATRWEVGALSGVNFLSGESSQGSQLIRNIRPQFGLQGRYYLPKELFFISGRASWLSLNNNVDYIKSKANLASGGVGIGITSSIFINTKLKPYILPSIHYNYGKVKNKGGTTQTINFLSFPLAAGLSHNLKKRLSIHTEAQFIYANSDLLDGVESTTKGKDWILAIGVGVNYALNKTKPPIVITPPSNDRDKDGVPDNTDGCPDDPNKKEPGYCGCGNPETDTDTDKDGTPDCNDDCPNDPKKTEPGLCGCDNPETDTDTDKDGTPDCKDKCPNDPKKTEPGLCGCGKVDTDTDNDGIPDCNDDCPNDPKKTEPGLCGCGNVDTDTDNDGIPDCNDKCPKQPGKPCTKGCPDLDGDCKADNADPDIDGDGINNESDLCPREKSDCPCGCPSGCKPNEDTDKDGDKNSVDPCPCYRTGTPQCPDSDKDGVPDIADDCPLEAGLKSNRGCPRK